MVASIALLQVYTIRLYTCKSLMYLQQLTGLELDDLRGDALRHRRDDRRAGGLGVYMSV